MTFDLYKFQESLDLDTSEIDILLYNDKCR